MSLGASATAKTFFSEPSTYLANNPYIQARAVFVRGWVVPSAGLRVLDVGAGDATASRQFLESGARVTLVDFSGGMLEHARLRTPEAARERLRLIESDVLELHLEEQFDVVLCLGVLAHSERWREVVARLAVWVRPGGTCIIQLTDASAPAARVTHAWGMATRLVRKSHRLVPMTQGEVCSCAEANALTLRDVRHHPFIPALRVLPVGVGTAALEASSRLPGFLSSERLLCFERR